MAKIFMVYHRLNLVVGMMPFNCVTMTWLEGSKMGNDNSKPQDTKNTVREVRCNGAITSEDVNALLTIIPNLTSDDRKKIKLARSSVAREWTCFMEHAEVVIIFDNRNAKLLSGDRTNRLLVHSDRNGGVEEKWEKVGWIMWTRNVCRKAYDVVVQLAPWLLQTLTEPIRLMLTNGET